MDPGCRTLPAWIWNPGCEPNARSIWCGRWESNPHALWHWSLKPACLPFHHFRKVVTEAGVEPACARHQVLSLACLPFHHSAKNGGTARNRTSLSGFSDQRLDHVGFGTNGGKRQSRTERTSLDPASNRSHVHTWFTFRKWRETPESNRVSTCWQRGYSSSRAPALCVSQNGVQGGSRTRMPRGTGSSGLRVYRFTTWTNTNLRCQRSNEKAPPSTGLGRASSSAVQSELRRTPPSR